jgi:hypothetical protein
MHSRPSACYVSAQRQGEIYTSISIYTCMSEVKNELLSGLHAVQAEEPGLAVFDGGSYSRGPLQLGVLPASIAATITAAICATSLQQY